MNHYQKMNVILSRLYYQDENHNLIKLGTRSNKMDQDFF